MGLLYREVLTLALLTSGAGSLCLGGHPVHCRMSNGVPGLHSLDSRSVLLPVWQPQPLGGLKSPGGQNHSGQDPLPHITGLWPVETGWEDPSLPL